MEMLEYCKTYSIMKSNLSNSVSSDLSTQNGNVTADNEQEKCSFGEDSNVVIESLHRIPGDFSLYHSITRSTNDSSLEGKRLSPLKGVAKSTTMISGVKTQQRDVLSFDSELTFAPKLNALSIKLAKERGEKMRNRRSNTQNYGDESVFTFKPKVSSNSAKIVQNMKTTFLDRQLIHMEKQRRHTESFIITHQNKAILSPVQMPKSPSRHRKTRKSKECGDSIEEENEDCHQDETIENQPTQPTPSNLSSNQASSHDMSDENEPHLENEKEIEKENGTTQSTVISTSTALKTIRKKQVALEEIRRFKDQSPYNQSVENLYLNKPKRAIRTHKRCATYPATTTKAPKTENDGWNTSTKVNAAKASTSGVIAASKKVNHSRSTSHPSPYTGKMKYDHPIFEKVRHAKEVAETAIKGKRVFICHGPYPIVRATLRRRGYVEKHYSPLIKHKARKNQHHDSDGDSCDSDDGSDDSPSPCTSSRGKVNQSKPIVESKGSSTEENMKPDGISKSGDNSSDGSSSEENDDGNDDDSDDEDWKAGYEEDGPDGEFNLMTRMVRNAVASFIWTVKRDDVDFKYLRKDQTVNHYSRAYSFTTKVGLCTNLRNLPFYEEVDPLTFFPRCHRLGVEDDKLEFIDDFRIGAAASVIKWVVTRHENEPAVIQKSLPNIKSAITESTEQEITDSPQKAEPANNHVLPVRALTTSLKACREYLRCRDHLDIDDSIDRKPVIPDALWDQIIDYSYQLRQSGSVIENAIPLLGECQNIVKKLKEHMPQVDIDGQKNIWIVKPGAKSRGRGIMCMDRLDDILKLTSNNIGLKEGRWVVQKYIERPLLIYSVKFDIRQWFLVTDWNPLTIWFYQDCYLRFCSHNFSLENFHVSIHLANNSVQKHFENEQVRDKRLPEENMWSSDEFKSYLKKKDVGNVWNNVIYPGMKQAVIYAMESCQEIVEYRKNSFELYGADFIIGDDFKPWLIEINCSPTMGASTGVTRKLCAQVVEDTMRVVLDKREEKNCDTGRFELAYKQAHISAPPYIGVSGLAVEGQGLYRKPVISRRPSTSSKLTALSRPRDSKILLNDTIEDKYREKRESTTKPQNCSPKSVIKRSDGAWAMGCPSQPRPHADEKIPKRSHASRAKSRNGDVKVHTQARGSRACTMRIPKAVLRYSTDASIQRRTQLPISIGPDH